jgi:hypothetical protein
MNQFPLMNQCSIVIRIMNSINMIIIVTTIINHGITLVINYSVRIPKAARIREHG